MASRTTWRCGGELAHPLASADAGARDQAVQAGEVELEGLELELGRGGLELAGADDELGDQAGERLVARREVGGRGAEAAAQVLGGAAGHRGGEELLEVGVAQALLALGGQGEAVGQERALGLLAAVEDLVGAVGAAEALLGARVLVDDRRVVPRRRAVVGDGAGARRRRSAAAAAAVSAAWAARRRRAGSAITLSTSVEGTLRRSETSLTSSLRSTLGPSGAIDSAARLSAASRASVPVRSPSSARSTSKCGTGMAPSSSRAHRVRAGGLDDVGRVLAGRQAHDPEVHLGAHAAVGVVLGEALQAAADRLLARRVGVLAEQHPRRQARQRVDLLGRQRRPHRADRLGHARLAQRDHVRVALDEHHAAGLGRRRPREVGAVDHPPLVEDLAVAAC